jgi:putative transposase
LLNEERAHSILRDIWTQSAERNGWYVGRYVLMPDHVHFFARAAMESEPMAQWTSTWKSLSSRWLARAMKISPPVWQRDYFDRYVRSSESYSEKWMYVRENPVRAHLVADADTWPFQGVIYDLHF